MGIKKVIKKGIKSGIDVKRWLGMDQIKGNASTIKDLFVSLFRSNQNKIKEGETFEGFMNRHNVNEEGLQLAIKNSSLLLLIYSVSTLLVFIYTIYLIVVHHYLGALVCVSLTLLLSTYTIRERFNIYRMKQRKLDCKITECFQQTLSSRSK